MARALKCDRCKVFYEPYNPYGTEGNGANAISLIAKRYENYEESIAIRKCDICKDCMAKLRVFLDLNEDFEDNEREKNDHVES